MLKISQMYMCVLSMYTDCGTIIQMLVPEILLCENRKKHGMWNDLWMKSEESSRIAHITTNTTSPSACKISLWKWNSDNNSSGTGKHRSMHWRWGNNGRRWADYYSLLHHRNAHLSIITVKTKEDIICQKFCSICFKVPLCSGLVPNTWHHICKP
jgi:hypothetical protein